MHCNAMHWMVTITITITITITLSPYPLKGTERRERKSLKFLK